MRPLLILIFLAGCGRDQVYPRPARQAPVVPAPAFDAGTFDAGRPDAGKPDAGVVDAGPSCPPPAGPPCPFTSPPASLTCIPGLKVLGSTPDGFGRTRYVIDFPQPVDHDNPNGPTFPQRLELLHHSSASPMVMSTTGYALFPTLGELNNAFIINGLVVEHRNFGTSFPDAGNDFKHLDIRQAAHDFHRIRVAFAPLYPKSWVSTGVSKGGMTMVYYRRFFPCDVRGTVAYVAPHSDRELDPRYNAFLSQVGGATRTDCRQRLLNLQTQLLQRRDVIVPTLPDAGYAIVGGVDVAFEMGVMNLSFLFWQYFDPDNLMTGCLTLPTGTIPDAELEAWGAAIMGSGGDAELESFAAYFYQAATQLGDPAPLEQPFGSLIRYPGKNRSRNLLNKNTVVPPYDPQAMIDIQKWLATQGESIVFVYGELDPWSATQFDPGLAQDTLRAIAPGNNHGAGISDLASTDRTTARLKVETWLGLKANGGLLLQPKPVRPEPRLSGPLLP